MLKEKLQHENDVVEIMSSEVVFDYIIHISDIHIRLSSRFEEYESVLKKFLDHIKHLENAIVVVTGDIFHHKNELTPDCIMFAISFFKKISKYHPLVIIPGNHDFLMNNLEKNDSITSVLFRRNLKNVFYLKESGCYRFGNLIFVHNSLWNPNNTPWILPSSIKTKKKKDFVVSLYHGMVGKCKTLSGYTFTESETLSVAHFSGSDFVLLGDIHHHQYIQENMAYAGSMISQNFNETNDEHGFILWNVKTTSSTFQKIENDYAYRRIDIFPIDNRIMYLDKSWNHFSDMIDMIEKNNRLEIHIHNDEHYDSLPIRKACQSKGVNPRIRYVQFTNTQLPSLLSNDSCTNDIQDPHSLTSLLYEYLKLRHDSLKEENLQDIIQTITENVDAFQRNHTRQDFNHNSEKQSWRILDITFDFIFGYGSGNHIIFGQHEIPQLIGIFGENSAGKSTLIDIILFMLYGRITRYASGNSVPQEIIHEKQDQFSAKLRLKVGHFIYSIEKNGKRNKKTSKIKINEELWRENSDGSRVNMTEQHRMKTDKMICDLIGPMEQFIYMSFCTQTPSKSFREMTQKDRKDFLINLFGLDSFETYHTILNTELKQLEIEEKSLMIVRENNDIVDDHEWTKRLKTITNDLQKAKDELTQSEKLGHELRQKFAEFSETRSRRDQLEMQILKRKEKYLKCQERFNTIHVKEKDMSNGEDDMDKIQKRLQKKRREMGDLRDKIRILRKEWTPLPSAPDFQNFSSRRWHLLRKRFLSSPHHSLDTSGKTQSRSRRTTGFHEIAMGKFDEHFCYFDMRKLKCMENLMNEFDKTCIPNIKLLYEEIRNHESELLLTRRTIETIQEEYSIHEDVEYDESCEKCKSNPFRTRKQELEKRMNDAHINVNKLKEILQEKKTVVKQKIVECLDHFVDVVDVSVDTKDNWRSMEVFSERWKDIREEICRRKNRIEEFQESMNMILLQRLDKIKMNERQEYEEIKTFMENLSHFMICKIRNVNVEREETLISEKFEKIESDCTKYENMITNCARQVERERLKRDMERMREEGKDDEKERCKVLEILKGLGDVTNTFQSHQNEMLKRSREVSIMEKDVELFHLQFEDWKKNGRKLRSIQQKISKQKIMLGVCNRSGLPSHILRTIVPIFGGYMNRILNHFTDRYVQFDMEKESGDIIFQTRSHDSNMCFHFYGGMESLMIDLATKITFAHFGYCPMSSFFVLDENISVLDEYHVQHIEILFSFLKQHFQHILLISHLPSIKNIVDKDVSVVKNHGYSEIMCEL
jgi:DNA repair exonuclease SbcCD ATPase subunit/DNA repair exonuclease SbcCD nuclease subunit